MSSDASALRVPVDRLAAVDVEVERASASTPECDPDSGLLSGTAEVLTPTVTQDGRINVRITIANVGPTAVTFPASPCSVTAFTTLLDGDDAEFAVRDDRDTSFCPTPSNRETLAPGESKTYDGEIDLASLRATAVAAPGVGPAVCRVPPGVIRVGVRVPDAAAQIIHAKIIQSPDPVAVTVTAVPDDTSPACPVAPSEHDVETGYHLDTPTVTQDGVVRTRLTVKNAGSKVIAYPNRGCNGGDFMMLADGNGRPYDLVIVQTAMACLDVILPPGATTAFEESMDLARLVAPTAAPGDARCVLPAGDASVVFDAPEGPTRRLRITPANSPSTTPTPACPVRIGS